LYLAKLTTNKNKLAQNLLNYIFMPFKIIANQFYLSVIDTFYIKKNKIAFTIYNYIVF